MNLHQAYQKVLAHYKGNKTKTFEFFNAPAFELKHKTPNDLIHKKQIKKVIDFINKKFK